MTKIPIRYKNLDDQSLIVYDIPVAGQTVEVHLRANTRSDRIVLAQIPRDDVNYNERFLSVVITKWGERDGITSLELMQPEYEEACTILSQLYREKFFRQYEFIECE